MRNTSTKYETESLLLKTFPHQARGNQTCCEIIHERVAKGGGREATYAGETVVAFEDGGVTYIFKEPTKS